MKSYLQYREDFENRLTNEAPAEIAGIHQAESLHVDLDVIAVGNLDDVETVPGTEIRELGSEKAAVRYEDAAVDGHGDGQPVARGEGELDVTGGLVGEGIARAAGGEDGGNAVLE